MKHEFYLKKIHFLCMIRSSTVCISSNALEKMELSKQQNEEASHV